MSSVESALALAYRREWARVLAATVRVTRDLDAAEDAVQDAFAVALQAWRKGGVPPNPGGWLTITAQRKAFDRMRRDRSLASKLPLLVDRDDARTLATEDGIRDDHLRLIFLCCHPALSLPARVALTLRLVCGLATADIAHLLLVSETTMAARITRAKKKIRAAGIPFRLPAEHELAERLPAVLASVYLLYTEGHTANRGETLSRSDLGRWAIDLARVLADLLPREAEVAGLLALLLLSDARQPARLDDTGRPVLLEHQDRSLWDQDLIAEGTALVARALRQGGGQYSLQAAIAAVHAEAAAYVETDWPQILALYDELLAVHPSPVAALGRAVALAELAGPSAGLAEIEKLAADPRLAGYHMVLAARADLLRRCGRAAEARTAYERAAELATNTVEADYFRHRADELG